MTDVHGIGRPLRRRWRVVDGIVLLDKPAGLTSTQALQRVRPLLQAEKAGHAGTLDPMATGMLPLCFGQATKACGQLLGKRKAYRATVAARCLDRYGRCRRAAGRRACRCPCSTPRRSRELLHALEGARMQVPPMYSALKREGEPLYELARRGEQVERDGPPVTIEIGSSCAPRTATSRSTSSAPRAPTSACSRRRSPRASGRWGTLARCAPLGRAVRASADGHARADRGLA